MVFRFIPILVGASMVILVLLFTDRKALIAIDWDLLGTFIFFFIFSSNMSRDPTLQATLGQWVQDYTLLASVISCQFISNVPSAILLSQFTTNYTELLRGVNIGGVGTLLSSLASLIALRHYLQAYPHHKWRYIGLFSVLNFSFLISLTLILLFL
jgi:di/tricarboxylate transporter